MLGKNYKRHRKNVLNIFKAYKDYREETNDGVDMEFLQNRIDSLANNKFTLAVAGEVKAGKSTFLNALLREELLPVDVLQTTSAVIEIFKSDKSCLKITYSDDTLQEFSSDCKEKIKKICSINDEYREIPITQINTYIQDYEKLSFEDLDLTAIEELSGIKGLNEKQSLIEKYIRETPKNKLPKSISLGHPLEWSFDELRLVDCPGVNATGGVQDLSYEYFIKANAIIFVHPIKPIESQSFRDFVTKVIPDKNRANLFLVLTHAGKEDSEDVERLTIEAKRLYGEYIDEKHIVAVDSILSLIQSDLEKGVPLETIRQNKQKRKAVASYKDDAEEQKKELVDILQDASGFKKMFEIIEEYSQQAPNLQLNEILHKIKGGYEELETIHNNRIVLLEQKKNSPQSFSEAIEKQTKELEEYRNLLYKGRNELKANYTGTASEYYKNLNKTVSKYIDIIQKNDSLDTIRKATSDAVNGLQDNMNKYSNDITSNLRLRMKDIAKDFESKRNINVPKIDLEAIEIKSRENAYRIEDVIGKRDVDIWDVFSLGLAWVFRKNEVKVGEKKVFDNNKHLQNIKENINNYLQETKRVLDTKSREIFEKYLTEFETKFNDVINDQQDSLKELNNSKKNNEEIISEIDVLKKKISTIKPVLKTVEEIINDISL